MEERIGKMIKERRRGVLRLKVVARVL